MPRVPPPLPSDLAVGAFTPARARTHGVGPGRLRRADVLPVAHGVHASAAVTGEQLLAALALVLPTPFAWSHLTAARLWGLPLPSRLEGSSTLHVMRPTATTQTRRPGVVGHRGLERRAVDTFRGLPVTSLVDTWCDLASCGLGLDDLVVAGDVVADRGPDLLPALTTAAARTSRRGARPLREAAALVRTGSRSRMETRTRLTLGRAGLPEPELNAAIYDDGGGWVACGDLVWREARVLVEYEGDHHRTDRRQWQHDIARVRLLEALGWRVVRVTARDLHGRALEELVALLRRLLSSGDGMATDEPAR